MTPDQNAASDVLVTHVSFLTITDQVARHLHTEILRGRWSDTMPGKHELAADLGVNNKTVEAALRLLEKDGLLIPQGAGRRRLINARGGKSIRAMRIAFLAHDRDADRKLDYIVEIQHLLIEAGHAVFFPAKSLAQLRFEVRRVARLVEQTKADAWIVLAGSQAILEWFASQPKPVFALFGQRYGLPLAGIGPNSPPAVAAATLKLLELGHRRIVLLCRRSQRLPHPSPRQGAFLHELQAAGIAPSAYNLPDWEETNEGFQQCLGALFRVTPPTALIVDEAAFFIAVLQFCARRGISVPGTVSLISIDDDPAFDCCEPPVSCIKWDSGPLVRRIVNWVANISRGKPDLRQTLTPSQFIPGGTIGPVRK